MPARSVNTSTIFCSLPQHRQVAEASGDAMRPCSSFAETHVCGYLPLLSEAPTLLFVANSRSIPVRGLHDVPCTAKGVYYTHCQGQHTRQTDWFWALQCRKQSQAPGTAEESV